MEQHSNVNIQGAREWLKGRYNWGSASILLALSSVVLAAKMAALLLHFFLLATPRFRQNLAKPPCMGYDAT